LCDAEVEQNSRANQNEHIGYPEHPAIVIRQFARAESMMVPAGVQRNPRYGQQDGTQHAKGQRQRQQNVFTSIRQTMFRAKPVGINAQRQYQDKKEQEKYRIQRHAKVPPPAMTLPNAGR